MTLESSLALGAFAVATGLALGTLGAGGAILAVPAFTYAAQLPHREASTASLLVVGAAALIGGLMTLWRCKHNPKEARPDFKVALPFFFTGLLGSWCGAKLSSHIPEVALKLLFGAIVLVAAEAMYLRAKAPPQEEATKTLPLWLMPIIGLVAGLLTGLVGVGGGFMIVPALTVLGRLPLRRAAATSLWIIVGNAVAALTGYIGQVKVAWELAGAFLAVTLVAMTIGQRFARRTNPQTLQLIFAAFLVVIGIFTLLKR